MPQSLAAVYLHLVFSTKHRHPFLQNKNIREATFQYLGGISKTLECAPIRVGGMEDHAHILARFGRTISMAEWVKELKRVSTLWLHEHGTEYKEFQWQAGYAVFSVSQSNLDGVVDYIERQEEHHKQTTFQNELRALYRRHNIEFDERYVWD